MHALYGRQDARRYRQLRDALNDSRRCVHRGPEFHSALEFVRFLNVQLGGQPSRLSGCDKEFWNRRDACRAEQLNVAIVARRCLRSAPNTD